MVLNNMYVRPTDWNLPVEKVYVKIRGVLIESSKLSDEQFSEAFGCTRKEFGNDMTKLDYTKLKGEIYALTEARYLGKFIQREG